MSYNCANGMIKDSKLDEFANLTTWRMGGDIAPKNKSFQMRLAIDMDNYFIDWYIEDQIVGSSKLPIIFRQGFRTVFALFNSEDTVLLNEEDWKDRLRISVFDKSSFYLEKKHS
mgnify:CR=1 FL=1